jgi:hypothetical protein
MMNSYWALLIDVTDDNDIITYGYTFRDKNMREAKLHALQVCRLIGCVPLPDIWRISHAKHVELSKYTVPTMMSFSRNAEEAA